MTAAAQPMGAWTPAPGEPSRTIHLFAMGFTQSLAGSGQVELWKKARRFSAENHYILTPMEWRDDAEDVARFVWGLCGTADPSVMVGGDVGDTGGPQQARIHVYAYSWGAGVFFVDLAEALHELGLEIDVAVLCDPVWRSRLLPTWLPFNPGSLLSFPRIHIPPNVRNVHRFWQDVDRPRAHRLKLADPERTRVLSDVELEARHAQMEDQPEYHELVLSIIAQATRAATPTEEATPCECS